MLCNAMLFLALKLSSLEGFGLPTDFQVKCGRTHSMHKILSVDLDSVSNYHLKSLMTICVVLLLFSHIFPFAFRHISTTNKSRPSLK